MAKAGTVEREVAMSEPVFGPGTAVADRVEIMNAVQTGPATLQGQFGARLDFADMGHMMFFVGVVDVEGNTLTIHDGRSYEDAIVAAEEAARDWGVVVHDLVGV
jgi:hypothetical protein